MQKTASKESGLNLFLMLGTIDEKGEWISKKLRQKTEIIKKASNPIWDQSFSL